MQQPTTTNEYYLEASEFNWDIAPGKTISAWGFNKQVPGPVLKAQKGETIVVKVKNNLKEPTIIHWHGIRLPAAMDGTEEVQKPILPGEEFEYRFVVPDAGTFWYHSHYNETVQMERGMYGALIVADESDPVLDAERVLVMDDMKLDENNQFTKGNFMARWIERHDGREGSTLLMNGREDTVIKIAAGQSERWRLINASSARYIVLHLEGKEFRIISTDGGLMEKAITATQVMLTPGERVDIMAGPFEEGENFLMESLPYNRTTMVKSKRVKLASVQVGEKKPSISKVREELRHIEPLAPQDAPVTRSIRFSVGLSLKHGIDFLVNNQLHTQDEPVQKGALQVWEIANTSLMDHPFHLHGFFFQVLEENGVAPTAITWKDTYNLKPKSKIKIAWMPDRVGRWMYHCHILEHHAAGMMGHFEVVDGDAYLETNHETFSCRHSAAL